MKFEYDGKSEDRECVAYIDDDGDLCFADDSGDAVLFSAATGTIQSCLLWNTSDATRKFYPGDKITITF